MANTITVNAPQQLRAWTAPNFATVAMPPRPKQEGIQPLPTIPVAELPKPALDALAQEWITDLYTKAGHPAPKLVGES